LKFIKHLLNDFLDFEKIQANTFKINTNDTCSIKQIIEDTKRMIDPFLYFEEKDIIYNCNNICSKIFIIDKIRVCQILINLLQNAIKYGKGKTIILNVDYNDKYLVFRISHAGCLDKSHIKYIFDPFYRVNMNNNDGTGLGLFICKNIIQKMNGFIGFVETDSNQVSIEFTLPVTEVMFTEKKTILIVDDFPGIRSTKMLLETKGFTVDIVTSGKKCVELCKDNKYSYILMDKNMNDLSGTETVRYLRNELHYNGVIFGFTGDCFESSDESFECSDSGVNDILYKPLDINCFLKLCDKFH
jgi:CheY-like chemotaxis protein